MQDFAETLRRLRSARGLSLAALGRRATYSRQYLSELERGLKPPSHDVAVRLDRALAADGQLVAALTPPTAPLLPALPPWGEPRDRISAVTAGRHRPDPGAVDYLTTALQQARAAEDTAGARVVLLPTLGQYATVEAMRHAATGTLHERLVTLEAQVAQFLGWLHQDLADHAAAGQWYARALELATEAGDAGMVASVLSMRSNMSWGLGDPVRAVRLGEASSRQPATPGVLALSRQQTARGYAALGDRQAALRALGEAEDLTARTDRDREPPWVYFQDAARLRIQRAMCLRDLGDHAAAVNLFEAGLADLPVEYRRDRATYLGRLALTHALAGERDGARAAITEARGLAAATGSVRALADLDAAERLIDDNGPASGK